MTHVLRLLDTLPRPHPGPLHQDLGGEHDEVLRGAPLEVGDAGQIVARLEDVGAGLALVQDDDGEQLGHVETG